MAILKDIGFRFSLFLFIGGFVFGIIGLYVSRYFNQKTAKLYTKYCVLQGVSFGLSASLLIFMLNGFSWETFVLAAVLLFLLTFLAFHIGHVQEMRIK